ncbi:MAG: nucleotidyltransferase family protein [Acidobacteriota bacterium]
MNKNEVHAIKANCTKIKEQSDPFQNTVGQPAILEEKLKIITYKVYEKKLQDIWRYFQENNLKPILIKGWAAALNYPKPYMRRLGDYDLAINPLEFERASSLQKKNQTGEVDLHNGLRKLDKTEWNYLYENSILKKCGDTDIRVLKPEDHLRVLCVHWLADGGREKEKLRDIYFAVKNRPANFDWDGCLRIVGERRRKWIIYTIGLTHRYYGLAIDDLAFAGEAKKVPDWMIKTLEKEWDNPIIFKYLHASLGNWKEFYQQLSRRFPPNPIQATVNLDGDFDGSTRIFYQIGDVFERFKPSILRVADALYSQFRNRR